MGLSAGHLTDTTAAEATQTEPIEPGQGLSYAVLALDPAQQQRKGHVVGRRQLGNQLAELEDETEAVRRISVRWRRFWVSMRRPSNHTSPWSGE